MAPTQLRFLGEERDLDAHGWDDGALAKLWRYNQHYFDDLAARGAAGRVAWHRGLIARWMAECAPGGGTAWEPYPTSLRIVNWIKWLMAGNEPVPGMLDSLAAQARFLSRRLEWHLLGNHLFVNAKALVFAGHFFEGREADAWRARGWEILRAEMPEQILPDGGQFERSPMYHALAVEDMLDLANLMAAFPDATSPGDRMAVAGRIGPMIEFLEALCHPDGEVSFFNDSAQGVAPCRAELEAYAGRLAVPVPSRVPVPLRVFPDSGFLRVDMGQATAILDAGPVGPDYLPGHAHADTLSFELSIDGRRVLVNSGTSQYGVGPERLRQRGTAAHNALTVDGADSSEVWGGFRVARRARARLIGTETTEAGAVSVDAEHDGFRRLPGGGVHRRRWEFLPGARLEVTDAIEARGVVESHWHFAPEFEVAVDPTGSGLRVSDGRLAIHFSAEGAEWRVTRSTYSPRFGSSIPNWKAVARLAGGSSLGPHVCRVRIEWHPCTSSSSPTTSHPR